MTSSIHHLIYMGNFLNLLSLMLWLTWSLCMTLVCVTLVKYVMYTNEMSAVLVNDPPSHLSVSCSSLYWRGRSLYVLLSVSSGYILIFSFCKPTLSPYILPVQHGSWMSHTPSSRLCRDQEAPPGSWYFPQDERARWLPMAWLCPCYGITLQGILGNIT